MSKRPTFNWELCVELHNRILDSGWRAMLDDDADDPDNADDEDYEFGFVSWWEHKFGSRSEGDANDRSTSATRSVTNEPDYASQLERRLDPAVVQFLKHAHHDLPGEEDGSNFFLYLRRLGLPKFMIQTLDNYEGSGVSIGYDNVENRYVRLYEPADHTPGGLVLDQHTMKALLLFDEDNLSVNEDSDDNRRWNEDITPWAPLEQILQSFLDMIEQRRVIAVPVDAGVNCDEEPPEWPEDRPYFSPWVVSEDDSLIVQDTVKAWHGLLSAVEARIPGFVRGNGVYYDSATVDKCDIKGHFISNFLKRARIPSFRFVAPGLRVATPDELSRQPFKDAAPFLPPGAYNEWGFKWYPLLFLHADRELVKPSEGVLGHPWCNAQTFETGLYLDNSSKFMDGADQFRLLLPFSICTNKCARTSAGHLIKDHSAHEGLYQPGWYLVRRFAGQRLEPLLRNWTAMIENGHWLVDEDGVVGGIEKFKEADTPEKSHLYVVERTW